VPLGFEQAFEVLARVDQALRCNDAVFVDQDGVRELGHSVFHAQGCRQYVWKMRDALLGDERAVLVRSAVTGQDYPNAGHLGSGDALDRR